MKFLMSFVLMLFVCSSAWGQPGGPPGPPASDDWDIVSIGWSHEHKKWTSSGTANDTLEIGYIIQNNDSTALSQLVDFWEGTNHWNNMYMWSNQGSAGGTEYIHTVSPALLWEAWKWEVECVGTSKIAIMTGGLTPWDDAEWDRNDAVLYNSGALNYDLDDIIDGFVQARIRVPYTWLIPEACAAIDYRVHLYECINYHGLPMATPIPSSYIWQSTGLTKDLPSGATEGVYSWGSKTLQLWHDDGWDIELDDDEDVYWFRLVFESYNVITEEWEVVSISDDTWPVYTDIILD